MRKAWLDGSNSVVIATGLDFPSGIVLDHETSQLFWTEYTGHRIQSGDLNGADLKVVVSSKPQARPGPWGITVNGGKLYWGDYDAKMLHTGTKTGRDITSSWIGSPISHLTIAPANVRNSSRLNHCAQVGCRRMCALTPTSFRCL